MIAVALIAGATVSFVASLRFAKWAVESERKREEAILADQKAPRPTAKAKAIAEKRRILESYSARSLFYDRIDIMNALLALADEERMLEEEQE